MSATTITAPPPMRMSIVTGVKALAVGAAAEGAAQTQSLTLTIVAGAFVLGAAIVVPITNYLLGRLRKQPVDHHRSEFITEQAELAAMRTIDHLIDEVSERDKQLAERDAEIARLKHRRRA